MAKRSYNYSFLRISEYFLKKTYQKTSENVIKKSLVLLELFHTYFQVTTPNDQ